MPKSKRFKPRISFPTPILSPQEEALKEEAERLLTDRRPKLCFICFKIKK